MIGGAYGFLKAVEGKVAVAHGAEHGIDGHAAGDFSGSGATHAVADDKIAGALRVVEVQAVGVFIGFTGSSLVGRTGCLIFQRYRLIVWHLLFPFEASERNCATIIGPEADVKRLFAEELGGAVFAV
jgi:hypothetical protein